MDEPGYILLENGGKIILENGLGFFILEDGTPPPPTQNSDFAIVMATVIADVMEGCM